MKISELIKELQVHLKEFGDLDVLAPSGFRTYECIDYIHYDVIKQDEHGNPLRVAILIES